MADLKADVPRPRALSIAGSDSGGGAGIQADLKSFSALGVYGMTALTAVTVQNTLGVSDYLALPPELVASQIRAVVTDIGVDAAKTGMLASAEIVAAVADEIRATRGVPLVVDPVFVSKHGDPLLANDAIRALRENLLPLAVLVTPNLPEASGLVGWEVTDREQMERAADEILALGPQAVLLKGGHLEEGKADDLYLHTNGDRRWLTASRIETPDTHGTGCTLAAAITAYLARGDVLIEAVLAGKRFVTGAIENALRLGEGIGPVDQLWMDRS